MRFKVILQRVEEGGYIL